MTTLKARLFGSALSLLVSTAACSAGTAPFPPQNPPGTLPPCNSGAQVALSIPVSGSQGFTTQSGYVQIVLNATTNVLGDNAWNVVLLDYIGNQTQGGLFAPASGYGGIKPFPANYYYNATIPSLLPGDIYKVYLNKISSTCQPELVGSFTT